MSSSPNRVAEIKPIIVKLNELHLNIASHPELQELMKCLRTYIADGKEQMVYIPFPAYNCTIEGQLKRNKVWVKFAAVKDSINSISPD
jgi:hypothetical protein